MGSKRVELLRLYLYLQATRPFQNIFCNFFIINLRLVRQTVSTVVQCCPTLVIYRTENICSLLSSSSLFWSRRFFYDLSADFFMWQLFGGLESSKFSSCSSVETPFSWLLTWFSTFAQRRRSTSRLAFRIMTTSAFATRIPFAAGFQFKWRAHQRLWYLVIFLCINHSVGSRLALEYTFQTALIINFSMWSFSKCATGLSRALLPTIRWVRVSINRFDWAHLSTLRTRRVSKQPCWTASISASSIKQKIGLLVPSLAGCIQL